MSDNKSNELKVAWVKLGKVWWPGKLVNEADYTDDMKKDTSDLKARKSSIKSDQIHVVEFFDEPGYEVINHPSQILLNVDEEKKMDLVKRAISTMKSSTLATNREKFEKDVLHVEQLVNPSADLTNLTLLLRGEPLEPKKQTGVNKYADIFPSAKPEKPSPAAATPGRGGKGSVKFNFPSSRIISTASSKPASKISPLPSDPAKKYHCVNCSFSADRVNIITAHMKYCRQGPQGKQQQPKKGSAASASVSSSPVPVPPPSPPVTTPTKATKTAPSPPPVAPAPESPVKKTPGRKSTRGKAKVAADTSTPVATSAAAVVTVTTTPKSVPASTRQKAKRVTTPLNAGTATPKKRGRRGKKDKQISDKQKSEILQDWNDSSSEENDSDDELAPLMPPTKPPELFLFGSEKNKKRKAGVLTPDATLGGEEKNGEGPVDGKAETENAAGNEDQPPVLKKPRTDKELSDAFEALLKNTKPDYKNLLAKGEKGQTDKKDDEEEMEVEEEEETNHLSDIEEDANIVMKKAEAETNANIVEKKADEDANTVMKKGDTENDKEEDMQTTEVEKELELDENTKQVDEIIKEPEIRTPSTRARRAAQSAKSATNKVASPPPVTKQAEPVPTPKRSTRKSTAATEQTKKPLEEEKGVTAAAATITAVPPSPATTTVTVQPAKAVVTNRMASPPPLTKQAEPVPTSPVTKQPEPVPTPPVTKQPAEPVPTPPVTKQPAEPVPTPPVTKQPEPVPTPPVTKQPEPVPTPPVTKQPEPVRMPPVTKQPAEPVPTPPVTKQPEPVPTPPVAVPTPIPTKSVTPTVQTKKTVTEKKEVAAAIPPATSALAIQSAKVETNKVAPPSPPVTSASTIQSAKVETNKVAPPSPVKKQAEPAPTGSPTKSVTPTVQAKKPEEEKKEVTVVAATIPPPPLVAATPATTNAAIQSTKTVTNKVAPLPPVAKQSEPVTVPAPVPVPTKPISPTVQTKKSVEEKKESTATVAAIPPPPLVAATPVTTTATVQSTKPAANKVAPPPPVTKQAEPVPIPTPKKSPQKKSVEEKKEVAATITTIPPPPLIAAAAPATTTVAASRATPSPQVVQKKPTAAVRPLVDTKEVAKEPVAPTPVKDVKGTGSSVPPPKSSPSKDQPQPPQQTPGVPSGTQQLVETEDPSGKKSPALVAQRVVHLVPVENADGSITYMLLSLENGADNPAVVLEQGTEQGDTILRLDKVESMEQGGPPNNPMNATDVEGIFLDKNVDNANQIVSALTAAATGTPGTVTTSMMDTTTAYVTLALDPTSAANMNMGVVASGSETTSTTVAGQPQSIVIPEGAATIAQEGGAEAVSQQVFYMTEDGAILDPQSLGLTYEQLQQLLNQ